MLRKMTVILIAMVLTCFQAGMVMAANPDTGPGCGPGKMIWAEYKNQKNIAPQVMMATTNVTGGTFAISTGTSGCTNDGVIMAEYKTIVFAELNRENLSQDMAQGGGEHLASLATLLGVPADQQAAFFVLAQERYQTLIQSGETSPSAMLTALHDAMAAHPVLAKVSMNR